MGGADGGGRSDVVGADLVEVIPTGVASADAAVLAGERVIREILTGVAMRKR